MHEKKRVDRDVLAVVIWYAEMRVQIGEDGWGGAFMVEQCTDEQRPILQAGLDRIEELFQQIDAQLEVMQAACSELAGDRWFANSNVKKALEDREQLMELRKRGRRRTHELKMIDVKERHGMAPLGELPPIGGIEGLIRTLAFLNWGSSDRQESLCDDFDHDLLDRIFMCPGFQLAVHIGDDAAVAYLRKFAEMLFNDCDTVEFAGVLLEIFKRRKRQATRVDA